MHPDVPLHYYFIGRVPPLNGLICPCILLVAMHPDVPYFIILLCLTPDNFAHQGERAATQWVNTCDTIRVFA
jgi:hypothetical protein